MEDPDSAVSGHAGEEHQITRLLHRVREGDTSAEAELYERLSANLKGIARQLMRGQPRRHTLQASALVNEAYLRLARLHDQSWQGRSHFIGFAARAMRCTLVDHERRRRRKKRAPDGVREPLDAVALRFTDDRVDLLGLHEALDRLTESDGIAARIVELRFFAGLSMSEVAQCVDRPLRTVERLWRHARAWLHRELT